MSDKKFGDVKDEETRKILEEMEEDGDAVPEFAKKPDEDQSEDTAVDKSEDDSEEEDGQDEETEAEGDEDNETESDTVESDEDDELPTDPKKRDHAYISLKNTVKKLTDKVAELTAAKAEGVDTEEVSEELNTELDKWAKETNAKPEEVQALAKILLKHARSGESKEMKSLLAERKEKTMWDNQDTEFQKDFNKNLLPIIKRDNPKITQEELDATYERINDIAWSAKNAEKSLVEIYVETKPVRKVTGEGSKGISIPSFARGKTLDEMSEDDVDNMSDKEFDAYSEHLEKKTKSQIVRH